MSRPAWRADFSPHRGDTEGYLRIKGNFHFIELPLCISPERGNAYHNGRYPHDTIAKAAFHQATFSDRMPTRKKNFIKTCDGIVSDVIFAVRIIF